MAPYRDQPLAGLRRCTELCQYRRALTRCPMYMSSASSRGPFSGSSHSNSGGINRRGGPAGLGLFSHSGSHSFSDSCPFCSCTTRMLPSGPLISRTWSSSSVSSCFGAPRQALYVQPPSRKWHTCADRTCTTQAPFCCTPVQKQRPVCHTRKDHGRRERRSCKGTPHVQSSEMVGRRASTVHRTPQGVCRSTGGLELETVKSGTLSSPSNLSPNMVS